MLKVGKCRAVFMFYISFLRNFIIADGANKHEDDGG